MVVNFYIEEYVIVWPKASGQTLKGETSGLRLVQTQKKKKKILQGVLL